jgi:antitoxin HicB
MSLEIPLPSAGTPSVPLPASMATKAAFYWAIRELGLSKVELAERLGVDEREVRRLLNPRHPSKLNRIEELLKKLGRHMVVTVVENAAESRPQRRQAS